ncbi:MAG: hypothetical protein Q4B34_02005 [Candidatus Saccharibacteria bacterium]|nr:hypothetical protein [Candidatus Saccharibacteria bacterium]
MNKDVIYIEPEDDITDIITKIENSKEKIIALVPPKKAGVFRSIVNIKLIAKAGAGAEKTIVLVTTDPSIIKLAAGVKLPVTKNLKTAPAIPTEEDEIEEDGEIEEVVEEALEEEEINEEPEEEAEAVEEKAEEPEEKAKKAKKNEKKEKAGGFLANAKNPALVWIREHKKASAGIGAGLVLLILVGVWAFAIAPAATITLSLRTIKNNFSENVTFTENALEEDASAGKFYLTQYKVENVIDVEFEATGEKNVGEKAKGEVVVYANLVYSPRGGSTNIGNTFTNNGLSFVATDGTTLSYTDAKSCENVDDDMDLSEAMAELYDNGCRLSARVKVEAAAPGTAYNLEATSAGWRASSSGVQVYSDSAMTGGTDKIVKIVTQSDIDKALDSIETASVEEKKEKLLETVPEDDFVIDASFSQVVGEAETTPKVGEEVAEGSVAKLSVKTTDSIFTIDKTKVEEFITEKAKINDGYKIFSMDDPFIENFMRVESGYTGKLKTSYVAGPKLTENDVVEIVKGKGFGTAQHDLGSIDGMGTVRIDGSMPWMNSVPNNPEKITVIFETAEK